MVFLSVILLFYILPIVIIKYFNRYTSPSVRLISDNPDGEDLMVSFCPMVNIVIAIFVFAFFAVDKIVIAAESTQGGKVREFLVKIIT